MISVTEAKKIIDQNVYPLQPAVLPLQEAVGLILAENIYAERDIPAFPQSSMDGYAFSYHNWQKDKKLQITREVAAGSNEIYTLDQNEAVPIFTGASVPP